MHTPTPLGKLKTSSQAFRTFFALLTLMVSLGFAPVAWAQNSGSFDSFVIFNNREFNGTRPTPANNPEVQAPLNGAFLGNFGNNEILFLNGARITSFQRNSDDIRNIVLKYRVFPGTAAGSQPINDLNLPFVSQVFDNSAGTLNKTFGIANGPASAVNLLSLTNGGTGLFTVELYFEINGVNTSNNSNFQIFDSNNGVNYRATFNVFNATGLTGTTNAPAPTARTTRWTGAVSSDWLNAANWTNGIPAPHIDAVIPPGPTTPRPPVLNNQNAFYSVRNLTLQVGSIGQEASTRAIVRITTGELRIYGDLQNGGNGILATTDAPGNNTTSASAFVFLAGANQIIDQGRFANLVIDNNTVDQNTGQTTPNLVPVIKSNLGVIETPGSLRFTTDPEATIPQTSPLISSVRAQLRSTRLTRADELPANTLVLNTGGQQFVDLKRTGTVFGETTTAYVLGVLKADRLIFPGIRETFGNIGEELTIFTTGASENAVASVTRFTGAAFTPVTTTGAQNPPTSIKRIFGNSFTVLQDGFTADVVFRYNNSTTETDGRDNELLANREPNLRIYRTTNGGANFVLLGETTSVNQPDPGGPDSFPGNRGFVRATGIGGINTITLADFTNPLPLPVELSAFEAKRTGNNTLLTWTTATEKDNKGFTVEVSTDGGRSFRSAGFVASTKSTSSQRQDYRFVDASAGKTGKRYYRLRQEDLDGKVSLSDVRVVDFNGSSNIASTLQAFPNPFTSDLSVSVAGAGSGPATLRLLDLTGRVIQSQFLQLDGTSATIPLRDLSRLNAGIYLVQLTLPSGQVQNFKVQKQ